MIPQNSSNLEKDHRLNMRRTVLTRIHMDFLLLFGLMLLAGIGVVILYSASGQNMDVALRQLVHLAVAFIVMFTVAQISPINIEFWSPWLFGLGLILLIVVLVFGEGKGAQRWLDLGLFRFQPSEIMKIAVPMMIAWFLSESHLPPSQLRLLFASMLLIIPTILVAAQPDLGTSLLIACSGFFVLLLAGLRWRLIIGSFILIIASTPLIWHYLLHPYQQRRVLIFLNPKIDPLGDGYHITQSSIAIGSGGLYGKGWLNGTQSHLDFLPERSTDFIFAVFSEEFGFIGILLLLALYLFIIIRGVIITAEAKGTFSRLLAGSLILTFFVYMFVNIGMVSGLLPVVGLPLPLISYGGTSIVTLMAAFGVLMSIQTHRKLIAS